MIINGGARAAPAELATHLSRADTNERVYVRTIEGLGASDIAEALRELAAVGAGARSRLPLYHANIDWRHDDAMNDERKARSVAELGAELGLSAQPHVVVEHVKHGRAHLHVVWGNIDAETMTAIPHSHNYRSHELVARRLEREFGHERVQGVHVERDGADRPERTPPKGEFMSAERSGLSPGEARAELAAIWSSADTGRAFKDALVDAGWTLANGDRRDVLVAIDPRGESHAINKKLTGLTAKEVRARLADIDTGDLPGVDQARDAIRSRPAMPPTMDDAPTVEPPPDQARDLALQDPGEIISGHGRDVAGEVDQQHPLEPPSPVLPSPEDRRRQWAETLRQEDSPPVSKSWGEMVRMGAAEPAKASTEDTTRAETKPDPSRWSRIVSAARERLAELGERLDIAFGRIRDQVLRSEPKVSHDPSPASLPDRGEGAMTRAPDSGPVNARLAADLRPQPQPVPQPNEARARDIQREIEAGRKAQTYDRDRMRDLSRQHYEIKGAAPDITPVPRPLPPAEISSSAEAPETRKERIQRLTDDLVKSWEAQAPRSRGPSP